MLKIINSLAGEYKTSTLQLILEYLAALLKRLELGELTSFMHMDFKSTTGF